MLWQTQRQTDKRMAEKYVRLDGGYNCYLFRVTIIQSQRIDCMTNYSYRIFFWIFKSTINIINNNKIIEVDPLIS